MSQALPGPAAVLFPDAAPGSAAAEDRAAPGDRATALDPDAAVSDFDEVTPQFGLWQGTIVTACAVSVVLVWTSGDGDAVARGAASGLLLGLAGWWWGVGRPQVLAGAGDARRARWYLLGATALFTAAVALVSVSAWVLIGLCVQPYMLRPLRSALAWVAAINAIPPAVVLIRAGPVFFWTQLAIGAGATAFSWVTGISLQRIRAQSEQRAELIEELRASRERIAQLSREAGMATERERLAAEIHDTLAQGFTSVLTLVQAAASALDDDVPRARRHLDLAGQTARDNLAEARALVDALAPAALDGGSLLDALRRQARRATEESGIAIDVDTVAEMGPLDTRTQVVLLRAAQEALANVRRHSGARRATIQLAREERSVRLTVCDDGTGFDSGAPALGFGLRGMRTRVEQIGGELMVKSGPGGTSVRVRVPA